MDPRPASCSRAIAGRRLASLPCTPVAGPLADDDDASAALVGAAVARVRERTGTTLQIKPDSPTWRSYRSSPDSLGGRPTGSICRSASKTFGSATRATTRASGGRCARRSASVFVRPAEGRTTCGPGIRPISGPPPPCGPSTAHAAVPRDVGRDGADRPHAPPARRAPRRRDRGRFDRPGLGATAFYAFNGVRLDALRRGPTTSSSGGPSTMPSLPDAELRPRRGRRAPCRPGGVQAEVGRREHRMHRYYHPLRPARRGTVAGRGSAAGRGRWRRCPRSRPAPRDAYGTCEAPARSARRYHVARRLRAAARSAGRTARGWARARAL